MPHAPDIAPEPSLADRARALGERQLERLERLVEIGLNLATNLEQQALPPVDVGLAYSRLARAVRLTIALQSRVMKDMLGIEDATLLAREARAADARVTLEHARNDRVGAVVCRLIRAEHERRDEIERLESEAAERLSDVDILDGLFERPIGETVAIICKDLGLSPDWSRWAQEPWAIEEAGQSGSPFPAPADPPSDEPDLRLIPQAASP